MEPFEEAAAGAAGVTVPAPAPDPVPAPAPDRVPAPGTVGSPDPGTVGVPVPGPTPAPGPAPGAAHASDGVLASSVVAPPQPATLRLRTQQCFPLGHIPVAGFVGSSPFLHAFLQLPSLFAHFLTYQLPAERRASHQAWVLSRPR